jgi:hypothetical protein
MNISATLLPDSYWMMNQKNWRFYALSSWRGLKREMLYRKGII